MALRPKIIISILLLAVIGLVVAWFVFGRTPKIVGADDADFTDSVVRIRTRLPAAERAGFDDAIATVLASEDAGTDPRMRLAGMTASEALALAADLRAKAKARAVALAQRLRSRIDVLTSEIAPLAKQRDADALAELELAKVVVGETAITQREWSPTIGKIMTLHFIIANRSERPVMRVVVTGTITSEGRAEPWRVEDATWDFKGGLQPSRSEHLHLNPPAFNRQPRLDVTPNMRLAIRVRELSGPEGGETIRVVLDDGQRKQLAELEGELAAARQRLAGLVASK